MNTKKKKKKQRDRERKKTISPFLWLYDELKIEHKDRNNLEKSINTQCDYIQTENEQYLI